MSFLQTLTFDEYILHVQDVYGCDVSKLELIGEYFIHGERNALVTCNATKRIHDLKMIAERRGLGDNIFRDYEIFNIRVPGEEKAVVVTIGELNWAVEVPLEDEPIASIAEEFKLRTGILPKKAWIASGLNTRSSRAAIEDPVRRKDFIKAYWEGKFPLGSVKFTFDSCDTRILKKLYLEEAGAQITYPGPTQALRILSLNVHILKDIYWEPALEPLVEFIEETAPDILCFQEFAGDTDLEFAQHISRFGQLGYKWHVVGNMNPGPTSFGPFGNVILSRLPIVESGMKTYDSQCPANEIVEPFVAANNYVHRNFVYARIRYSDNEYVIYNTHLDVFRYDGRYRELQAGELFSHALKHKDVRLVVCGDFNDTGVTFKGLYSAFPECESTTWDGNTVDYIFTSVVPGETYLLPCKFSDHSALAIDV
jgi:endonuclease/exonuclease/phosphatase family metal-dependent hydrolase